MQLFLKRSLQHLWPSLIVPLIVMGIVIAVRSTGLLQAGEWAAYDRFFLWRPLEPADERITIVGIDESDIQQIGRYPIPDAVLAQAIEKLKTYRPKAIGMDIYRDVSVPPGGEALKSVFQSTSFLIGVEKKIDNDRDAAILFPRSLLNSERVGLSDVVPDGDGKLRRGLLYLTFQNGQPQYSLGFNLALMYLQSMGIQPENFGSALQIGKSLLTPFEPNDGGYVNADAGGYQILLNWRGSAQSFRIVSLRQVLADRVSRDWVQDRIVLIGHTAPSVKDFFYTPYSHSLQIEQVSSFLTATSGVEYHANLTSQILSAALDGRAPIRVWAKFAEYVWIFLWAFLGARLSNALRSLIRTSFGNLLLAGSLVGICYLAFLAGWWIPLVPSVLAILGSALFVSFYKYQSLSHLEKNNRELTRLASTDYLTQVANRRQLEQYLQECWQWLAREGQPLSLIMCDIDHFKAYNDIYGHPQGDICLQEVARAILEVVKRRTDLVARYGGEEFTVILPRTPLEDAIALAEAIRANIKERRLEHEGSLVDRYISLSFGIATMTPHSASPASILVARADYALYQAKQNGRDRVYSIG